MTDTAASNKNSLIIWALRLVGSGVFLWVVFQFLPVADVVNATAAINPLVWLAGLGVFLTGHIVAALKWRILIKDADGLPAIRAIRAHFAGLAANLCLPGVAGGDVVRAGLVMRDSKARAHVAVGSLIDRLLDTIGLLILAFLGGLWAFGGGVFDQRFWIVIGVGLVGAALAVGGYALLRKLDIGPLKKIMDKINMLIAHFLKTPGRLVACLGLSMTIQSAFILTTVMLAQATMAEASLSEWFFAWPLAKLVAILPVSLAGLGVREAGLAAILGGFGADPARVVAASLLWQFILFAGGILGGIILLLTPSGKTRSDNGDRAEAAAVRD